MGNIAKSLYSASLPASSTNVYAAPQGKYILIKSIILTNYSSVDRTFNLIIGGIPLGYNHTLKANGTLVIDDTNLFLFPGDWIQVSCSASSSISMFVSGEERDYVLSDFPYKRNNGTIPNSTITVFPADSKYDWVIKSIIITNMATVAKSIDIAANNQYLLTKYSIKPNDTLIVPLPNLFIPKGNPLTMFASSGGSGSPEFGLVAQKVVQ